MCCFTGKVAVSNTRIFARFLEKGTQALVYQMSYRAASELAMVLPIPTPPKASEDAVKFISLKTYKTFFDDLHAGFPEPKPQSRGGTFGSGPLKSAKLKVEEVGDYIASFVPSVADFDRLDAKFRLPAGAWEQLPKQKTYGFAVFQLKADATDVHPMAFTFPTRPQHDLFFPTVHIHDGAVHDTATFDHTLYLQPRSAEDAVPRQWEESARPASMFTNQREAQKLIDPDLHVFRRRLHGKLKNVDMFV
jgi:hypothetical protein